MIEISLIHAELNTREDLDEDDKNDLDKIYFRSVEIIEALKKAFPEKQKKKESPRRQMIIRS